MAGPTDLLVLPNSTNGLKMPSIARTGKIATLDKTLIKGLLGKLTQKELTELDEKLKILLQLPYMERTPRTLPEQEHYYCPLPLSP